MRFRLLEMSEQAVWMLLSGARLTDSPPTPGTEVEAECEGVTELPSASQVADESTNSHLPPETDTATQDTPVSFQSFISFPLT